MTAADRNAAAAATLASLPAKNDRNGRGEAARFADARDGWRRGTTKRSGRRAAAQRKGRFFGRSREGRNYYRRGCGARRNPSGTRLGALPRWASTTTASNSRPDDDGDGRRRAGGTMPERKPNGVVGNLPPACSHHNRRASSAARHQPASLAGARDARPLIIIIQQSTPRGSGDD